MDLTATKVLLSEWEGLLQEMGLSIAWRNAAVPLSEPPRFRLKMDRHDPDCDPSKKMTGREQQICRWLLAGKTCRETAEILGISLRTVEKHVQRIYVKTGTHCRTGLFRETGVPCN